MHNLNICDLNIISLINRANKTNINEDRLQHHRLADRSQRASSHAVEQERTEAQPFARV